MLFHSEELKKRTIRFNDQEGVILYIESLTDTNLIRREVLQPLIRQQEGDLEETLLSVDIQKERNLANAVEAVVAGESVLILDGNREFFVLSTAVVHKRNLSEPENESVIRGPHNGFVEQLTVNLYSIRKRIESPHLTVRFIEVGRVTKTKIAIVYMRDLTNPDLVEEVERRIQSVSSDAVLSPGFIQEFTEDNPYSPFPQHLNTERPDRTVSNLMEGRVALLAEEDPTALIVPVTLYAFYQAPDDYNSRWLIGSFIRVLRFMSFMITTHLPALYIATISFHPEILPIELIFTIKDTLEQVPFPPLLEAMLMELIFELLREAGVRLPSRVGQTIGIVGGLVIGEAIVQAGLVSYTMIIVVALTAISSFLVPSHEMSSATRLLRFPLMFAAATFGYIGISFGLMIIFIHLCKLKSFGTPYLAPLAPLRLKDMKDAFLRAPIWKMNQRPHDSHPQRMKQEAYSRGWKHSDPGTE
ncbi:spore germination protein [Desmospora profundinema]|nr:spore germination protein [Desmospora profundinema]